MEIEKIKCTLQSKTANIIQTGSVIIPKGDFVEFQIANLRFRLVFEYEQPNENGETKPGRIESKLAQDEKGDYLLLILYNQTGVHYAGLNEPAQIAQIEGHPLRFEFTVVDIHSGNCKLLFYTWMLDNEINTSIINQTTNE